MHQCWLWSREALQPRESDWHFHAVIPLLYHAQGEVSFSTECYPTVPGLLPLSRCCRAAARGGDLWPLCLSGQFLISNLINKKMNVPRQSVPTSVTTIHSWVKKRDPICFVAEFPLKLSFLPIFQLSFNSSGPRDEPSFLLETFNRAESVSKIPDCCNFMKALAEQRREGSTHPLLLWERLAPCSSPARHSPWETGFHQFCSSPNDLFFLPSSE